MSKAKLIVLILSLALLLYGGMCFDAIVNPPWDIGIRGHLDHSTAKIQTNANDARAYYGRGELLEYGGKFDEALIDLHKAVELDSDLYMCRWLIAEMMEQRGDREAALRQYQRMEATLAKKPDLARNPIEKIRFKIAEIRMQGIK